MPTMAEMLKWREGQTVEWPKVAPYTIVQLVGDAGNIHISKLGRYHVFWHREGSQGEVHLIHHGGPLEGQLGQFKGEPYFSRAQEFISALSPVKRHWQARDYQSMLAVLTEQTREIEIWRRRIKEEYEGVGFGRYSLS